MVHPTQTRHTTHARYNLWYHLAFATKYRKTIFTSAETQQYVAETLRAVAAHYDMELDAVAVQPDHAHMTVSAPPRTAPARAAQILKSVSTKLLFENLPWLKQFYWGGEIWAAGYFIRSVGPGLTKEQIDRYVLEQAADL